MMRKKREQLTKQVWVQMEVCACSESDGAIDVESHKAIVVCERTETSIKETTQILTAAVA